MIYRQVNLHRVHLSDPRFQLQQDLLLPNTGHYQVVDQSFEFILGQALLENELVVFHDCVYVQLHVQFLEVLVLLEPRSCCVLLYVELSYFFDELADLLLVQNVTDLVHSGGN